MDLKAAGSKRKIQIANIRNEGRRLTTVPIIYTRKEPKGGTTSESKSSNSSWEIRARNRAMPKSRGKLVHLGDRPTKPHGWPAISRGLPALVRFLSALIHILSCCYDQ
jgi:hypothetical protein